VCAAHWAEARTQVVFGEGDGTSGLLLLGEAPGQDEDREGRPFIGPAGRILDALLAEARLSRELAYVTNTVLCHPPEDRDPTPLETGACSPYLAAQLDVIQPRVIVTLGLTPLRRLLGKNRQVERDHGQVFRYGTALVVPTFHPAALRWRTGRRETAVRDLTVARMILSART
jgi:DNA polymerase